MTYKEQIGNIKFKDAQIRKNYPEVEEMNWRIKDIPLKDFNEIYDSFQNKCTKGRYPSNGCLFFIGYINSNADSKITFESVPVKTAEPIYEEL